jgi:protein TonB
VSAGIVTASIADRLSSTIFVAALAHGVVILGVTFAPEPPTRPEGLPSLNVTLLVDTETNEAPEKAELLASTNALGGGGDDDSSRPTTTLAADHPLTQVGDPLGADLVDALPRDQAPQSEQLATRAASDRQIQSVPDATDSSAPVPMRAAALIR